MTSIPDPDEKVIYYDPHTTADLLAAIDCAMQPLRDTTIRAIREAQSIYELSRLSCGAYAYVVAETCHAAGCDYAETIRAIRGALMKRVLLRDRKAREAAQDE